MPCHHSCFFNWHAKKITKNSCKRQEVQGRGYTLMCERWRIGTLNKFKVVFSCFQLHWYRGFLWSCQILCFRVLVDFKNLSFLHAWAHCSDCKKRWQCIRLRIVGCVCDVQLSSGITHDSLTAMIITTAPPCSSLLKVEAIHLSPCLKVQCRELTTVWGEQQRIITTTIRLHFINPSSHKCRMSKMSKKSLHKCIILDFISIHTQTNKLRVVDIWISNPLLLSPL